MAKVNDAISEIKWANPVEIEENGNPRSSMDPELYQELVESIKANGIFQPLVVKIVPGAEQREDGAAYILVAGHRRHRAALELGLEEVPVAVLEDGRSSLNIAVAENLQREGLSLADEARVVARMLEEPKATVKQVAKRLNKGESWVARRASIGALPEDALAIVQAGVLPGVHLEFLCDQLKGAPHLIAPVLRVIQYQQENVAPIGSFTEFSCEWTRYLEYSDSPDDGGDASVFLAPLYAGSFRYDEEIGDEKVNTLLDQCRELTNYQLKKKVFEFSDTDRGAAEQYGALLTITEATYGEGMEDRVYSYIIDRDWFVGFIKARAGVIADAVMAQKKLDEAKPSQSKPVELDPDTGEPVEVSKEEKKQQREKELKARWKAVRANHDLWSRLLVNLGEVKVLTNEGVSFMLNHRVDWVALNKAMLLLDPQYLETEEPKVPKFKVFEDGKGSSLGEEWVMRGKTPEERMQRAFGLIAAAKIMDGSVGTKLQAPWYVMSHPVKAAELKKLVSQVFTDGQLRKLKD